MSTENFTDRSPAGSPSSDNHSAAELPWGDRLCQAIARRNSAVCVGLDPRGEQLPASLRCDRGALPTTIADTYREFCTGIIDAVADLVPVVKPQAAFFEQLGPAGMVALGQVVNHALAAGLLVIMDGKRNDIGSTAEAYADAYLGAASAWRCDSLTVSPYLGDDSLQPFVDACDRTASGVFVLVKTSNPGGGFLQDQIAGDAAIYRHVARWVTHTNASRLGIHGYGPVGAVVGATYPAQLAELRAEMPGTIILIPGFGAQGGAAQDVAGGFDQRGTGAIVNNSRHIIFAYQRKEYAETFGPARWQDAARAATEQMNEQLNAVRPLSR
jgi:orotidine-5'-phosphate decarboxylase